MGRKFLIISLVISVVFLAFLIFDYMGGTRYIKIHTVPTEKFLKNYKNLKKPGSSRIVVSFSCTRDNIDRITPFINSILDQTIRVDDIALSIPYKDIPKIPAHLKPVLSVYGKSVDYPDLVCGVLREPEAKTKIFVLDPTLVYGQDFLETMLEVQEKSPEEVVTCGKNQVVLIRPEQFSKDKSNRKRHIKYRGNYKIWGISK